MRRNVVALAALALTLPAAELHIKHFAREMPGIAALNSGERVSKRLPKPYSRYLIPWEIIRPVYELAGIRSLAPVPDGWVLAAVPEKLAGTRLVQYGIPTTAIGKLSLLPEEPSQLYIAEFFPDVTPIEARRIALAENVQIVENPDLRAVHLMIRANGEQLLKLAEWDDVAFLFPASRELERGEPVTACAGALNASGSFGQYVARVGEGWDGPGRHPATVAYSFQRMTGDAPADVVRSSFERALAEWTRHADITFVPAASAGLRTLSVMFTARQHGDPFAFDGSGGVLAHTFYPAPTSPEPLAGDLHFDDDERWQSGAGFDFFSVALHEIGHALGLGHSDTPGAVMYPYYRISTTLATDDISALQSIYAERTSSQQPPDVPQTPETPPSPPPPPQPAPSADATAPSLRITYPYSTILATSAATLVIRGTASDSSGVAEVTWTAPAGQGVANGTTSWSTPPVPLYVGVNSIIIRARDNAGNTSWRSLAITRR